MLDVGKIDLVLLSKLRTWWGDRLKRDPLPKDAVIPIKHALQGHPESPRLWDKYISKILIDEFEFNSCTHESCLYYKTENEDANDLTLIVRVVDDLIICNKDPNVCNKWAGEL